MLLGEEGLTSLPAFYTRHGGRSRLPALLSRENRLKMTELSVCGAGGRCGGVRCVLCVLEVQGGISMGYRPPKGVRPPQLEGKRTGRPKGSRKGWSELLLAASDLSDDVRWAYQSRFIAPEKMPKPPTPFALVLSRLSRSFPEEYGLWYERGCGVLNRDDQ
jgi:hypothetical protein